MTRNTFTLENPALPMHYPGFVFRLMCAEGYCPDALLEGTNLTQTHLADPEFRCGFASLQRFYLNVIELSGDPHIGMRIAMRFEPHTAGMPVLAALNAPTLEEGLRVFSRFAFLTYPAIEFAYIDPSQCVDRSECAMRIRMRMPVGEISHYSISSALVVTEVILQAMMRRPKVAHRAEMVTPEPEGWDQIADELPFPVQFGADEDRIAFAAELLPTPLPGTDPLNHRYLTSICERMVKETGFENTLAHQVLEFLEEDFNLGASLAQTACALGLSERSLRRQLEQTGTSFRRLVRDARERHARKQLITSDKSIQAIAFELGFDTASNFSRSFKQWTGVTPSAFRARQMNGAPVGQN